ncbi:unnamed protein product [Albugo candida]|uniref:Uncharacterized protein n=1 Tax=Albugo candida TaxID=65357 RepID=A0A024GFG9_9STRA|nr:unnamed protein product [Albugo candida]|eukprot:CCI45631.1 unnamed protein product [Albugo candida]
MTSGSCFTDRINSQTFALPGLRIPFNYFIIVSELHESDAHCLVLTLPKHFVKLPKRLDSSNIELLQFGDLSWIDLNLLWSHVVHYNVVESFSLRFIEIHRL